MAAGAPIQQQQQQQQLSQQQQQQQWQQGGVATSSSSFLGFGGGFGTAGGAALIRTATHTAGSNSVVGGQSADVAWGGLCAVLQQQNACR
jgi:hypothetical protein